MSLLRTDVNNFSKASFNFSCVPVFTLCRFSDKFLMLRTLLPKSLHDASFFCLLLLRQPPAIDSNKFKDFKTFEYYGIRIETFELTTVEYRRVKNLDSKTKIRIT